MNKALWTTMPNAKVRQPKKRKPVRRVSKAMAKRKKIYNDRVKEWLKITENTWCRVSMNGVLKHTFTYATQVHHSRGRLGKLLMDERHWIPVSAEGHRWIDANREKARQLGLLCPTGKWNVYEPEDGEDVKRAKSMAMFLKNVATKHSGGCTDCGE